MTGRKMRMRGIATPTATGTTSTTNRTVIYVSGVMVNGRRGIVERFQWCRCGDALTSLWDRIVGRCWVCRSVR